VVPETAGAVLAHCWGAEADVFLGTQAGGVLHWAGADAVPLELPAAATDVPVTALLMTRQHVIVGTGVRSCVVLRPRGVC
jgi:hypothetical protein